MLNADYSKYLLNNFFNQEQFFNMLHNQYIWADMYIYYYVYVVYAQRDSIVSILESISEDDKDKFSPQKAYLYLKEYEKKRLNFAVIIPTYNRPKAIEYLLNYAAVLYRRYGIDIIIYDSSEDNKTKEVVEKMQKNGYYNVIYSRYTGIFDGFSLDHKVINAYKEFGDTYEYIWMCRDGLIPIIDEMIDKLRFLAQKKIDCIIVDTKSRNNGVEIEKYYSTMEDCKELLLDHASRLQTLGMLIISNRLINRLLTMEPLSDKNYSLWQMAAPFHLYAKEPFDIVFFTKNVFAPNENASSTHFWSKASKILEQWGYRWYHVIMNMPNVYDNVKDKCLMIYTVDFHPFYPRNLLEMRGWGGLKLNMVIKYKKYILKVTNTPLSFFYVAAILPRTLARYLYKESLKKPFFYRKIRNILHKIDKK